MSENNPHSRIEITIGDSEVTMVGSEEFLSEKLPEVLDRVELSPSRRETNDNEVKQKDRADEGEESSDSESDGVTGYVENVAGSLGVSKEAIMDHFYVEDEEVHIQSPLDIEPKYALLGYCILKEEITGQTFHDNQETKKKLIDDEKVDIEKWGSHFLYNLRRQGLIKDDPNASKDRNLPFKITPSGNKEFADWVNEDR